MPTPTVENYLKALYLQQQDLPPGQQVAMGKLAEALNVAPGTVTAMIKALADSGLVDYTPRSGTMLTQRGEMLALHVLRRHRLVELFLVSVLGLDWSEVHDEAEELEHAISDKVLSRIDALLGHPRTDPHGDPIPTARGKVQQEVLQTLAQTDAGSTVRIVRVLDQQAGFLQFLDRNNLMPGTSISVASRDKLAAAVTVQPHEGDAITLGASAAEKILVEPARTE
jgi:DtxR family transcriptional regulator, Mn-dependent transcriptional regulator